MGLKRGDIVISAGTKHYGKPRPALVVRADVYRELASVTVLPLTSDLQEAYLLRIGIEPDEQNGLELPSQIMVDKITTVPRDKVGKVIGSVSSVMMVAVTRSLAVYLGFA
jgi:mRNA interferase MazF